MRKSSKQILMFVLLIALLIIPYLVFAANPTINGLKDVGEGYGPYQAADDDTALARTIGGIVKVVFGLLGVIFVGLIIYAGYNWMTATGDEAKVTKAKDTIRRAIIGLIILIGSFAIYNFIFMRLISKWQRTFC